MKQYYDLIMKGYEIDEKNDYQLIKITHDKFNIMTKAEKMIVFLSPQKQRVIK